MRIIGRRNVTVDLLEAAQSQRAFPLIGIHLAVDFGGFGNAGNDHGCRNRIAFDFRSCYRHISYIQINCITFGGAEVEAQNRLAAFAFAGNVIKGINFPIFGKCYMRKSRGTAQKLLSAAGTQIFKNIRRNFAVTTGAETHLGRLIRQSDQFAHQIQFVVSNFRLVRTQNLYVRAGSIGFHVFDQLVGAVTVRRHSPVRLQLIALNLRSIINIQKLAVVDIFSS